MFHQFSVGGDVLKVSGDQQLEEDHGVNGRVARPAIKFLRVPVKETQVEHLAEPSVKVVLGNTFRRPEAEEQFSGVVLSALHTISYPFPNAYESKG